MSLGRRKIRLEDHSAWIFNRMVDAYEARPAYPEPLLDAIAELPRSDRARVLDVGAGVGHLALPLAERGFEVTALEPAEAMLQRLAQRAVARAVPVHTVHGMAEALPFEDARFDLVVVADAIHFLDVERAAYELARVMTRQAALALVTCEFTDTPFMRAVTRVMEDAAPRRPRSVSAALAQFVAVTKARRVRVRTFCDETQVEPATLEGILRSISFIGPAMNEARYAAFSKRIHAIEQPAVWARTFTLRGGRR
jgi:ubiquinone/menaquinone biosynthesis C-methylase UbiE